MPRSAAAFLIFFALGCNREIDEHTHPLVEHEHSFPDHTHADESADAFIVSIDPPSPSPPWSIAVTAQGKLSTLWGKLKAGGDNYP